MPLIAPLNASLLLRAEVALAAHSSLRYLTPIFLLSGWRARECPSSGARGHSKRPAAGVLVPKAERAGPEIREGRGEMVELRLGHVAAFEHEPHVRAVVDHRADSAADDLDVGVRRDAS